MNEVRRYVPRNLRDDGMIEAHEVAHYTHLNLSQYVLAFDYDALAARVQELEREAQLGRDLCAILQNHVGETGVSEGAVEVLQRKLQQLAEAQGTIAELRKPKLIISEAKVISYLANEVQNVLERIGHPHAFVTDMSTLGDFSDESQVAGKYLWQTAIDYLRAQSLQAEQQVARLRECLVEYMTLADKICYAEPEYTQYHTMKTKASHALRETGA